MITNTITKDFFFFKWIIFHWKFNKTQASLLFTHQIIRLFKKEEIHQHVFQLSCLLKFAQRHKGREEMLNGVLCIKLSKICCTVEKAKLAKTELISLKPSSVMMLFVEI